MLKFTNYSHSIISRTYKQHLLLLIIIKPKQAIQHETITWLTLNDINNYLYND